MTGAEPANAEVAGTPALGSEAMARVARRAGEFAKHRDSGTVGTVDLLFAVMELYDRLFDRALYLRGSSREELIERLAENQTAASKTT
jgi:hypothetical protein